MISKLPYVNKAVHQNTSCQTRGPGLVLSAFSACTHDDSSPWRCTQFSQPASRRPSHDRFVSLDKHNNTTNTLCVVYHGNNDVGVIHSN